MRRSDREIKEFAEIVQVMECCDVCRLSLNDTDRGYPYILPLNFGIQVENGQIMLYFHGASQGRKYELIAQDSRASFEMDCAHKLVCDQEKGSCTMEYESVIGQGIIEQVSDAEKLDALQCLMRHYHQEAFSWDRSVIPQTTVLRLRVEQVTGKRRKVK